MTDTQSNKFPGKPIRVGLIGFGNWAKHGHVRVLDLLPQYELSALYSQRADAAADGAATYGFRHVVDSVDALVNHPEVDLVVILTTAPQHEEGVRAAIAAGKDVYCEWPLTLNVKIARELEAAARQKGVRHVVGLQRRTAPHNRYLRDLIQDGFVGKLRSVRMHVSMNYFQGTRSKALRWTAPPENFSSVIAIYAGHFVDMLLSAVGWPVKVSALMVNQFDKVTIAETGEVIPTTNPDQLVLSGVLPSGAVLSIHIEGGKRNGSGVQIDITGDAGDIRITNSSAFGAVGDDYVITGVHGDNQIMASMPVPASYDELPASGLPSAVLELAHLYDAYANDVAHGTHTTPGFEDAIRMHDLLETAEQSSTEGRHLAFNADPH